MRPVRRFILDEGHQTDRVVLAVAPIDAFTGRNIASKLEVRIVGVPYKPIRNLSGMFVFVSRPDRVIPNGPFQVRITSEKGHYFDPEETDPFDPNAAGTRQLNVPLYRRPTFPVEGNDTVVSGLVWEGAVGNTGIAAPGLYVQAHAPKQIPTAPIVLSSSGPTDKPFVTRTDERGAFALFVRIGQPQDVIPHVEGEPETSTKVDMTIEFWRRPDDAGPVHSITGQVHDGKRHAFEDPVNLSTKNSPPLTPFGKKKEPKIPSNADGGDSG